jgi:hypothetical protein
MYCSDSSDVQSCYNLKVTPQLLLLLKLHLPILPSALQCLLLSTHTNNIITSTYYWKYMSFAKLTSWYNLWLATPSITQTWHSIKPSSFLMSEVHQFCLYDFLNTLLLWNVWYKIILFLFKRQAYYSRNTI